MKCFFDWPKALTKSQAWECETLHKELLRHYDSYSRLDAVLEADLSPDIFYACLGQAWSSFDNIAQHKEILGLKLAKATRKQLSLMMTNKELREWEKLPPSVTAYRFAYDNNLMGFSYSLDREYVVRFSGDQRYVQPKNTKRYIATASIPKKYTVLKLDRKEDEIIVAKPDKVTHLDVASL